MRPELLIFDCDGVLVDSEIIGCRVAARELGRLGFTISEEEIARRFVGRPTQEMLTTLAAEQRLAVPEGFRDVLLAAVADAFPGDLAAVPNVPAAIARIDLPMCVASSSDVSRIEESLKLTGLLGAFGARIFSAQMVERGKPFPDLYLLAARTLETAPAACLVVEDSAGGVEAAVAAGMRVFGFTGASHCGDGSAARLTAAGAELVFDDFAHLPSLIERIGL